MASHLCSVSATSERICSTSLHSFIHSSSEKSDGTVALFVVFCRLTCSSFDCCVVREFCVTRNACCIVVYSFKSVPRRRLYPHTPMHNTFALRASKDDVCCCQFLLPFEEISIRYGYTTVNMLCQIAVIFCFYQYE